jgi:hypothetical protein
VIVQDAVALLLSPLAFAAGTQGGARTRSAARYDSYEVAYSRERKKRNCPPNGLDMCCQDLDETARGAMRMATLQRRQGWSTHGDDRRSSSRWDRFIRVSRDSHGRRVDDRIPPYRVGTFGVCAPVRRQLKDDSPPVAVNTFCRMQQPVEKPPGEEIGTALSGRLPSRGPIQHTGSASWRWPPPWAWLSRN